MNYDIFAKEPSGSTSGEIMLPAEETVTTEGVYIWIDYEVSSAYEWGEQECLFRDLLEPLGLTHSGSGVSLGFDKRDIDFGVPMGTNLHTVWNALDVDLGFRFDAKLVHIPCD